jgi:hypothetical protein
LRLPAGRRVGVFGEISVGHAGAVALGPLL